MEVLESKQGNSEKKKKIRIITSLALCQFGGLSSAFLALLVCRPWFPITLFGQVRQAIGLGLVLDIIRSHETFSVSVAVDIRKARGASTVGLVASSGLH